MNHLKVFKAFDRTLITTIAADNTQSLEKKITKAVHCFQDYHKRLQPFERMQILHETKTLLSAEQEAFAELIAAEGGKPYTDARVEVLRAIDGLDIAAEAIRSFGGKEIPMGLSQASTMRLAFTTKEPIGVVAAISAFNHPLNLIIHQIAPAIATGCPVIIKPASTTPLCCLKLVDLFRKAGLGEAYCQTLITADNALAEQLATDKRIAFLSFIGSAKVGWYLKSKLAAGVRSSLEHGGAAPVIVDKSADLQKAISLITKGGYYHAGQVCVSVQRIFVHQEIVQPFIDSFTTAVQKLSVGDPALPTTDLGPLILPQETERVLSWVDEAEKAGAIRFGGGRLSETTLKPAVLLNPPENAKVSQLEIFGPVTCVYSYDLLDKAIHAANALPFAFQSAVFSEDLKPALHCAERLQASTVLINDHTAFRTDWMPFAGLKESGYGIGGIPFSMEELAYEKLIVFNKS